MTEYQLLLPSGGMFKKTKKQEPLPRIGMPWKGTMWPLQRNIYKIANRPFIWLILVIHISTFFFFLLCKSSSKSKQRSVIFIQFYVHSKWGRKTFVQCNCLANCEVMHSIGLVGGLAVSEMLLTEMWQDQHTIYYFTPFVLRANTVIFFVLCVFFVCFSVLPL